MKAYTDMPIRELGDQPYTSVIRECEILSYDGDKYCRVRIGGIETTIKRFYLYSGSPDPDSPRHVPISLEVLSQIVTEGESEDADSNA